MDRKWLRAACKALTGRAFVAALVLAAVLIALPALRPSTSALSQASGVQAIAEHDALRTVYDGLPARIAQLEYEVTALPASLAAQRALEGARDQYAALTRAFAARDEETYLTAVAAYYETVSGLAGSDRAYYDARAAQLHAVAELDEPELYRLPQDMPTALYLVSDQFSAAPLAFNIAQIMGDKAPTYDGSLDFLVLLIPLAWAVVRGADAAWATLRRGGEKQSARGIAGVAAFATVVGIVACAVAILPAAIVAGVRNGLGDLSYPTVTMRGAAYEISTVGAVLVGRAALYVALAGFVAALSAVSLAFTRSSKGACAAMALMLFAVAQPWYFAPLSPVSNIAYALPMTYFDVARLTGVCRDVIVSSPSTCSPVGASALGGIAVLSAFAGALLGAAALGVRLASFAAPDSPATPGAVWSPRRMMRSPVMWAILVLAQASAVWPLLAPQADAEASSAAIAQLDVAGYTLALLRFTPLVVLVVPSMACALGFAWQICRGAPPGARETAPAGPLTMLPVSPCLPRIVSVARMSLRSAAWGSVFLCAAAMPAQLLVLQLHHTAAVSHELSLLMACGAALFLINFIASWTVIAAAAITRSFARACATAAVVGACVAFADSEARAGGRAAALHQICRLGLLAALPLLVDMMRPAPVRAAFACAQGVRALSGVLPYAQRCWYTAFMARAGRVRGSGMGADGQGDEDDDPQTAMGGRMASCRNRDSNDHRKQAADRLASSDGRFFMRRASVAGVPMFGSLSREAVELQAELNEAVRAQNEAWLDAPSSTEAEERSKAYLRESNTLFDEMLAAPDDQAFYEAEARYERFEADHAAGAGRMAGTDAAGSELRARFMERLVELDDPAVYTSTTQMPALVMLAAGWQENLSVPGVRQLGALLSAASAHPIEEAGPFAPEAYCMALLPMTIVAVRAVSWRSRERLLTVAPISGGAASAVTIVVSTLLSLAALGITMAPAVIWLAVQLTRRMAPAVVVLAALVAVPLAPEYFETWSSLADIAPWLPPSYFAVPLATGSLGYFINAENVAVPLAGMSVGRGAAVLGVDAAACVLALALVHGARAARRLRAHSGGGGRESTGILRGDAPAPGASGPTDALAGAHAKTRGAHVLAAERDGRSATLPEYISALVVASRGVPLACVTATLVLMAIVPGVLGFASGMEVFERTWYEGRLRALQADYAERASAMSADERQAAERQVALCREVVYARDEEAFVDAAIAYETWCTESAPAGSFTQGSIQKEGAPAMRASFFRMLRASGDVRLFSTAADMPAVPYLAFLSRMIPLAVWAAPSCVIAVRIAARMRTGLLHHVPARLGTRLFAHIALSVGFGAAVDALALAAALLVAGFANGWGELSYPHVTSMAGQVVTAGVAIGRHAVAVVFANVLVSCCAAAAAAILCRDRRLQRVPAARSIAYR